MKKIIFLIVLLLTSRFLISQNYNNIGSQGDSATGREKKSNYLLTGFRHGVSYFPQVIYSGVEYEAGETLSFDRYHSLEVIYMWLERWAEKYPDILQLYEVGRSYEGRPIYQVTISARSSGKDTEKPGAYFEGGRHSGEITASESALWLIKYLVENYGKDPEITHLVDTRTIYIRPVNNPDGHNLYLKTAQSNRSTVRPFDNDGDGLLDEDSPEDLDGDGLILNMRWKDEKRGTYIPDPAYPTGRLMKQVPAGKGIYLVAQEGFDNDGDGRVNEDGIGGLDLHRNYPENWRPQSEETGRGYTQSGAGEYPLSETETRTVVTFLLSHPNVYVVNSMDTSVPMHLRAPSTSASEERMYPEDLSWYRYFDELGKKITGYSRAGDVFNDYNRGNPLFGHGPDFGYWYFGAIWYGDEIWNGGRNKDYNGDGTIDQSEILKWDDEENNGDGFIEWKPARHPVYGDVELGGFNPKFFSQNPPPRYLEKWVSNQALFNLELIKALPELKWENIEIKKIKSYRKDSADYQIRISYKNTGLLPTALKQAHLVKIVRDDRVVIEIDSAAFKGDRRIFKVLSPSPEQGRENRSGRDAFSDSPVLQQRSALRSISQNVPDTKGGAVSTVIFEVRVYGNSDLSGKASVYSTRGGVLKNKEFYVKQSFNN